MKKSVIITLAAIMLTLLILTAGEALCAEKSFGLEDIPEIKNKTAITIMLEAGGEEDALINFVKKFTEKTGVLVKNDLGLFDSLYPKVNIEFKAHTGAYDIPILHTAWTNEWAPYLYSLEELAEKYEPEGVEAIKRELAYVSPGLLRAASNCNGVVYGWPYECHSQMMYYRKDVFENPIERANFAKKYGYELFPPERWGQLRDQAEFFTRKVGDKLKGEVLTHDIYGTVLMAGRYATCGDEVSGHLWGMDGDYARTIRDENGKAIKFVITKKDKALLQAVLENYRDLMQFTPPGSENCFYTFVIEQFAAGNVIIVPSQYLASWPFMQEWGSDVGPGAEIGPAPSPHGQAFWGSWCWAVSRDSKNPEAAYWLAKYMGSYEPMKAWTDAGFAPSRTDILNEPKYTDPPQVDYKHAGHYATILKNWEYQAPLVSSRWFFNTDISGNLYNQLGVAFHDVARGAITAEEGMKETVKLIIEIQTQFGTLPIEEEK